MKKIALLLMLLVLNSCSDTLTAKSKPATTVAPSPPVTPVPGASVLTAAQKYKPVFALPQLQLNLGEEFDLAPHIKNQDGTAIPADVMVWMSSAPLKLKMLNDRGKIKALATGNLLIAVAIRGGLKVEDSQARLTVKVIDTLSVQSVIVAPAELTLKTGEKKPLTPTVQKTNGEKNTNVTWSSLDESIAVVNPTTGEVSALKEGSVNIIAKYTSDPRFQGICRVTISNSPTATTQDSGDVFFAPDGSLAAAP